MQQFVSSSSKSNSVRPKSLPHLWVAVLLVITLIAAGYLRFSGLYWDDFTHLHPDERFLTNVATSLNGTLNPSGTDEEHRLQLEECMRRYPDTNGVGGFFDALCSTWNPHNTDRGQGDYVYGTLPLFTARIAADGMVTVSEWIAHNILAQTNPDMAQYDGSWWRTYDGLPLVWRVISGLSELVTTLAVFAIGWRLHGKGVGLLAAILYSFVVFSIQMSHFGTADAFSNMCSVLSILAAVYVQQKGRLRDYILFGIFFGAALASRINLLPLIGLVGLGAIIQIAPAFTRGLATGEREWLFAKHILGVVVSVVVALIIFRLTNPYMFVGPTVFGLSLNSRFLDDMTLAQSLVSGSMDMPPNYQWVARSAYIFPFTNMVIWGMGVPLGLAGWIGFGWSLWRLIRGKPQATANLLLIAWIAVYFGYMGRLWVMTMRYNLPIYPALTILGAWLIVRLVTASEGRWFKLRRGIGYASLVGVVGFTVVWALMFTNIYRNLLTRVQASNWVYEQVPSDFSMRIEGADDTTPLINIGLTDSHGTMIENDLLTRVTRLQPGLVVMENFRSPVTGTATEIYAPHLGDISDDPGLERLNIRIIRVRDEQLMTETVFEQHLTRDTHISGDAVTIPLATPFEAETGETYRIEILLEEGGPLVSGGSIFTWEGAWDDPIPTKICSLPDGITLADEPASGSVPDSRYCNSRDPWWGLVTGYEINIVYDDNEAKRDLLETILQNSDYIAISSNRFYDTLNRNPARWPMSNLYYRALFAGELGYDLVATFQETFEWGPFRVSDQYLPTYDGPEWLNEIESEEAFSVYDHPVVFIFQRSADYDPARVQDILGSVPLVEVNSGQPYFNCPYASTWYFCSEQIVGVASNITSEMADAAPTHLRFTEQMRETQYENGTWSERFHPESIINTNQVVGVIAWWVALGLFGLSVFPLFFKLLPGLSDRGYAFAKFGGMFLTGWITWFLSSLRIPVWSQVGIAGAMIALFVFGVLLAWRSRAEFVEFIRKAWKRLLVIELITWVLFIAFIGVRLTNPDLWVSGFGGEKPMDFAYFNGVLRSTIFPAIDPWYAGGFINYYYFGFVIVGTPVLLLGITPSFAYNLILPTLFATAGIGAFSVAYSAAHRLRDYWRDRDAQKRVRKLANPFVAGVLAILLSVVVGNLDTPRIALTGLAQMGGYVRPTGMQNFLIEEYTDTNGMTPPPEVYQDIVERVANNNLADRLRYELDNSTRLISSITSGLQQFFDRVPLRVNADRWFWGPSRVYAETPGVEGGAITEMPAFTFIYADMHAHMISMPMQFALFAFILNEILVAGKDPRNRTNRILQHVLIGVFVGMLRATNTWDWITYMIFAGAGLSFAWWLSWRTITRESLTAFVVRVGGFAVASFVAVMPFTSWYASTYNSVLLWHDGKSPLWAFLDIHGLFIFLIVSFLIWDTVRWLRREKVSSLRGKWLPMFALVGIITLGVLASVILAMIEYQVTLIVLPLLIWVTVLFFRRNQSRVIQFLLALMGLALGLTLGVEYIVLGGDIGRQNTVFKFYIQAWLMFSVVGAVAASCCFEALSRWWSGFKYVWYAVFMILFGIAALFPVMAIQGKAVFRQSHEVLLTLDGMDYMQYSVQYEGENAGFSPFTLAEDYAMIRWLQDNVQGTPVILEGLGTDTQYRWNGRISIYTGLPTVVGWNFHQRQQRTLEAMGREVEMRNANVNAFYQTSNIGFAWRLLQLHDVQYLIVGRMEQAYYLASGLEKFAEMETMGLIEPVFTIGESVIYRVNHDAVLQEVG